jgi:hypothetical protein
LISTIPVFFVAFLPFLSDGTLFTSLELTFLLKSWILAFFSNLSEPQYPNNVKGKHANLVFHLDAVVMKNANHINKLSKDSFYSKALPAKIDYEKLSP